MGRNYVNKLIVSTEAVKSLPKDLGTAVPTERAARELARVEPERRQEVVERAAANSGGRLEQSDRPRGAVPVMHCEPKSIVKMYRKRRYAVRFSDTRAVAGPSWSRSRQVCRLALFG